MDEHNFTSEEVKKLLDGIIGPINTVGETHIDSRRFANLKLMCELVDSMITDIDTVGCEIDSHMHSVKRSAEYATNFLTKIVGIEE